MEAQRGIAPEQTQANIGAIRIYERLAIGLIALSILLLLASLAGDLLGIRPGVLHIVGVAAPLISGLGLYQHCQKQHSQAESQDGSA